MQLSLVWLLWATLFRPGVLELDQQAVPRSCPYLRAQCCGVSVSLAPAARVSAVWTPEGWEWAVLGIELGLMC